MHAVHFIVKYTNRGYGWTALLLLFAPPVLLSGVLEGPLGKRGSNATGFVASAALLWVAGWALDRKRGALVLDEGRGLPVRLPSNDVLLGIHVRDWTWLALALGVCLSLA